MRLPDRPQTKLGLLFGRVAEEYDRVRPEYPASLVDSACRVGGLVPGSRVVEVGCGTGKLTGALAERGLRIDAVDPDAEMIAIARRRLGDAPVRFHLGGFETLELAERSFDAVFSATAFHWVDPALGWKKAARLLRAGGLLALLSHVGGRSEHDEELHAAWREVLPESSWVPREPRVLWAGARERRGNVSEVWAWLTQHDLARVEAAQLYDGVQVESVRIDHEETAEDVLAFVRTTSSYLRLEADRRERLETRIAAIVEKAGGRLRSSVFATLVTARAR